MVRHKTLEKWGSVVVSMSAWPAGETVYLYRCLSEETLKAIGPFFMVSMPADVKDPTRGGGGVNV